MWLMALYMLVNAVYMFVRIVQQLQAELGIKAFKIKTKD